jgi:hypothetical protein
MNKPKTIIQAQADKLAGDLAKSMNRELADPIIVTFKRGIKMVFGRQSRLNKQAAEDAERQPSLFGKDA